MCQKIPCPQPRSRPRDPTHPTPTSDTWPSGHVTSHSTIDKVPVTGTKRLVCFNLVSVRYIHFYMCIYYLLFSHINITGLSSMLHKIFDLFHILSWWGCMWSRDWLGIRWVLIGLKYGLTDNACLAVFEEQWSCAEYAATLCKNDNSALMLMMFYWAWVY